MTRHELRLLLDHISRSPVIFVLAIVFVTWLVAEGPCLVSWIYCEHFDISGDWYHTITRQAFCHWYH